MMGFNSDHGDRSRSIQARWGDLELLMAPWMGTRVAQQLCGLMEPFCRDLQWICIGVLPPQSLGPGEAENPQGCSLEHGEDAPAVVRVSRQRNESVPWKKCGWMV